MKIQNSEGQILEVPRHLRKAVKKMIANNQHDEVSQIFGCGGMIDPITGTNPPLYGLGGTIGSLLQTAAPFAALVPGVGSVAGLGAGVLGAGLQALDRPSQGGSPQRGVPMHHMSNYAPTGFAEGGETGLVPINIEGHNVKNISMSQAKKGELLVHQGRVHKNYISRPPHPAEGQNPLGNDEVAQGLIVIPKDRSTEYLNAGAGVRKQIERSIVSQQQARESRMMKKGGYTRPRMDPGGLSGGVPGTYDWNLSGGQNYNPTYQQTLPTMNNFGATTPISTSYPNYGTQVSGLQDGRSIQGNTRTSAGLTDFQKMNLGQAGLSMIPAIGDVMDMTAAVQSPNYQTMRGVNPNLIDPNTGQAQVNQAYRTGANSLRDSGVYSIKSNRNLVADRMYNSGTQAINIANQNAGIKNQFTGMNADINKFNVGVANQAEDIKMMGQAKRREARRNLLDRAPAAASQYMQNGLYAKMLGI